MADKEPAQVFARFTLREIAAQKTLQRIRHFGCSAAISNRSRGSLVQTKRAADTAVVGIVHAVMHFDLRAFNADVSDPVLAATVWASSNVKLQMLIEAGQAFFQFFDQPARETLGLGDC